VVVTSSCSVVRTPRRQPACMRRARVTPRCRAPGAVYAATTPRQRQRQETLAAARSARRRHCRVYVQPRALPSAAARSPPKRIAAAHGAPRRTLRAICRRCCYTRARTSAAYATAPARIRNAHAVLRALFRGKRRQLRTSPVQDTGRGESAWRDPIQLVLHEKMPCPRSLPGYAPNPWLWHMR